MNKWIKGTLKLGGAVTRLIPHLGIVWNILLAIIDLLDGDGGDSGKPPNKKMLEQLLKRIKELKQTISLKESKIASLEQDLKTAVQENQNKLELYKELAERHEIIKKEMKTIDGQLKHALATNKLLVEENKTLAATVRKLSAKVKNFEDPHKMIVYPTVEQINDIIKINPTQVSRLSEKRMIHCVRLMVLQMKMVAIGMKYNLDDGNVREWVGHRENSLHYSGLAQDINLYKDDWTYLTDTMDHQDLGLFWEQMEGAWGGDFAIPDGNHYSTPIGDGRE